MTLHEHGGRGRPPAQWTAEPLYRTVDDGMVCEYLRLSCPGGRNHGRVVLVRMTPEEARERARGLLRYAAGAEGPGSAEDG